MEQALEDQWMFTGEMFLPADYEMMLAEEEIAVQVDLLNDRWTEKLREVFSEAGLELPKQQWMQSGGKQGRHTEHLGYLLAEMQYLQRAYPNATW